VDDVPTYAPVLLLDYFTFVRQSLERAVSRKICDMYIISYGDVARRYWIALGIAVKILHI
jgi:hypothetical protein